MAKVLALRLIALCLLSGVALGVDTYIPYCSAPEVPNDGSFSPKIYTYAIGARVDFSCKEGFNLIGKAWATCLFTKHTYRGYWSYPTPVCKRKLNVVSQINIKACVILVSTLLIHKNSYSLP